MSSASLTIINNYNFTFTGREESDTDNERLAETGKPLSLINQLNAWSTKHLHTNKKKYFSPKFSNHFPYKIISSLLWATTKNPFIATSVFRTFIFLIDEKLQQIYYSPAKKVRHHARKGNGARNLTNAAAHYYSLCSIYNMCGIRFERETPCSPKLSWSKEIEIVDK